MIEIDERSDVYPLSDDTLLLLEAVEYARGDVLELFAGNGLVGLSAARRAEKVVLADISLDAIRAIARNAEINGIKNYETVESDLFDNLTSRKFDIIYMNPPYLAGVPDPKNQMDVATLGGKNGYELTLRALKDMPGHLKTSGIAFVILSTAYPIEKVYKLLESINFKFDTVDTKKFFFEELILIKTYEKRRDSDSERSSRSSGTDKLIRAHPQGKRRKRSEGNPIDR